MAALCAVLWLGMPTPAAWLAVLAPVCCSGGGVVARCRVLARPLAGVHTKRAVPFDNSYGRQPPPPHSPSCHAHSAATHHITPHHCVDPGPLTCSGPAPLLLASTGPCPGQPAGPHRTLRGARWLAWNPCTPRDTGHSSTQTRHSCALHHSQQAPHMDLPQTGPSPTVGGVLLCEHTPNALVRPAPWRGEGGSTRRGLTRAQCLGVAARPSRSARPRRSGRPPPPPALAASPPPPAPAVPAARPPPRGA